MEGAAGRLPGLGGSWLRAQRRYNKDPRDRHFAVGLGVQLDYGEYKAGIFRKCAFVLPCL